MGEGGEGVIGWISLNEFNFNGRVGRHRPAGYKKNPIETMERGEKKLFLMDGQERLDDTATNQIFLFLFRARIGFFFVGFVCHFLGFGHKKKFSFWKMRNAQTRPPAAEQKGIPKPMGVRVQCVCCIFQNREADSSFCVCVGFAFFFTVGFQ